MSRQYFACAIAVWAGASLASAEAYASPQSKALIAEGVTAMQKHDFAGAYSKFQAAQAADPNDGEAWFYEGAALNRLGRYREAVPMLSGALRLRATNPDLYLEAGWALGAVGEPQASLQALERYERAHPGHGLTSEFMGRDDMELHRFKEAEQKLDEAKARDPALTTNVDFFLGELHALEGQTQQAASDLSHLMTEAPEAPISQTLREQLQRLAGTNATPQKPWHITLSEGVGYDDNVVALGTGQPLPTDISHKDSPFELTTLDAGYVFTLTSADTINLGYGLSASIYDQAMAFNSIDNYFHADYRHVFRPDLYGSFKLSDEYTLVGGTNFRNQIDLRPALAYRFNDWIALEGAYDAAVADYYFPTLAVQDRTGVQHTFSLTAYLSVPQTQWQGQLGTYWLENDAEGSDFVYHGAGVLAGVSHPLLYGITGSAQISYEHDDYSNPNSLAGAGFAFRRADDVTHIVAQAVRPITGPFSVYARYEFLNSYSNISFYSFQSNTYSVGLTASF